MNPEKLSRMRWQAAFYTVCTVLSLVCLVISTEPLLVGVSVALFVGSAAAAFSSFVIGIGAAVDYDPEDDLTQYRDRV